MNAFTIVPALLTWFSAMIYGFLLRELAGPPYLMATYSINFSAI